MKTKTLLELVMLSSSIYHLAKDAEVLERINQMSEKGKDNINKVASETILDDDGQPLELMDKIIYKTSQLKEEFEEKIEELVIKFYKKINVAHLDDIKALEEKVENADRAIALLEARLNKLDIKIT